MAFAWRCRLWCSGLWRGGLWRCSLLLLGAGVLAGCTHPTVVVTRAAPNATAPGMTENVDGIPFYAKYGVCTQETVWLEPQYTWTLTIQADDQPPVTKMVKLSGYGYQQPAVQEALGTLQALNGKHAVSAAATEYCPFVVREPWSEVSGNPEYAVRMVSDDAAGLRSASPGTLVRVANTATVSAAVDYSRVYYINARTPFIGTGNLDAKLSADGTLGEGNGQVNDQTWATVLGALSGMSSFAQTMSGIAAPAAVASSALTSDEPPPPPPPPPAPHGAVHNAQACQSEPGWPDVQKTVTYMFAVMPVVYQHDHTQQTRLGTDGVCAAATGMGVTGGSFVVSQLPDPAAAAQSSKPPAPDAGKKPDAPAPAPAKP